MQNKSTQKFEEQLLRELYTFNNKYFPSPEYKRKLNNREINENKYASEKEKLFLPIFQRLVKEYDIKLGWKNSDSFLDKWYFLQVKEEIEFVYNKIKRLRE